MLLSTVVNVIQEEAGEVADLSANNGIIGTFLYFVGIMAIVIFVGAVLQTAKD
jgi:hypothetical protein